MKQYLYIILIQILLSIIYINCDDSSSNYDNPIHDSSRYIVGSWDCSDFRHESGVMVQDYEFIYTFNNDGTYESREFEDRTPNIYYNISKGEYSINDSKLTLNNLSEGTSNASYEDAEGNMEIQDISMNINYYANESIFGIDYVLTRKGSGTGFTGGTWACTYSEDDYELIEEYTFGTETVTIYYKESVFSESYIDEGTVEYPLTMKADNEFEYDMNSFIFSYKFTIVENDSILIFDPCSRFEE